MMTENIFKEQADKKHRFKQYAKKAHEFTWINDDEYKDLIYKLDNDILTIGVIGQMKCGKSTFLNALVYSEQILPAAATPMTASLSVITYGEQKKLEAEFYTSKEWEELKYQSNRDLSQSQLDNNITSKIKAAKEIVEKSLKIESEIAKLLDTKKEEDFVKLIDYVGADGKYTPITKSVKIFMPLDYLKGVQIVDTPGFNDPVVSRVERTKDFLKKADAVIMLLYAGRAFDSVDKDIIFNQLRTIGIGKLLIGINKYDTCISEDSETEIITNVKRQLLSASEEYSDNSISILATEKDPLLLSANMALMSKMNIDEISQDSNWKFYYDKALDIFGISSQKEMLEKSLFPEFEKALMEIIFESKDEILLKKPKNFIVQKIENRKEVLEKFLMQTKNEISILKKPNNELEDLLRSTQKAQRKISRKIENIEIKENLISGAKKLMRETKDMIFEYKKACMELIDNNGIVISKDNLNQKIRTKIENLEIDLERLFEKHSDKINVELKNVIRIFINNIEEIAEEYLEDFEIEDYIDNYKKILLKDIININFWDLVPTEESKEENFVESFLKIADRIFNLTTMGGKNLVRNVLNGKGEAREFVNNFFDIFNLDPIQHSINENGDRIKKEINEKFLADFLDPIIEKATEAIDNKNSKEEQISAAENKLVDLQNDRTLLHKQELLISSIA